MSVDLITGKTFGELVREFAEVVGLASYGDNGAGKAQAPTDVHDLDQCRRFVNRGYKMFLQAEANWTFVHHPMEFVLDPTGKGPLNINNDPARMVLPPFIRAFPKGNLRFQDNRSTYCSVVPERPEVVERWRQVTRTSGTPTHFTIRPIPDAEQPDGGLGRHELIIFPSPTVAYTLRGDWRIVPYDMREDSERHVAGAEHDETILAAARHLWDVRDKENADEAAFFRNPLLLSSIRIDRRNRPKTLGRLRPGSQLERQPFTPFDGLVRRIGNRPIP